MKVVDGSVNRLCNLGYIDVIKTKVRQLSDPYITHTNYVKARKEFRNKISFIEKEGLIDYVMKCTPHIIDLDAENLNHLREIFVNGNTGDLQCRNRDMKTTVKEDTTKLSTNKKVFNRILTWFEPLELIKVLAENNVYALVHDVLKHLSNGHATASDIAVYYNVSISHIKNALNPFLIQESKNAKTQPQNFKPITLTVDNIYHLTSDTRQITRSTLSRNVYTDNKLQTYTGFTDISKMDAFRKNYIVNREVNSVKLINNSEYLLAPTTDIYLVYKKLGDSVLQEADITKRLLNTFYMVEESFNGSIFSAKDLADKYNIDANLITTDLITLSRKGLLVAGLPGSEKENPTRYSLPC